jgi:ubiquinone/menaquinone biosynthesis C-methylase UbiE
VVKKKQAPPIKLDLNLSVAELLRFPWPYQDASVEELTCAHKLEYVPGGKRVRFMEEAYRVLILGGKMNLIGCYWSSPRSIQDPDLQWPPLCEQSFLYFNKGWRAQNKLPEIGCDFDFTYGYQVDPETAGRNTESQAFWIKHYNNTVNDVQIVLTKR